MFAFSRFLLYFTEVARQGSFRKASEALHVSASSIDRQILRVEQELAMPLFERHPTGLRLTAAGELLLHAANNWKKDFTRVCEQLDDLRGLRRGHVRRQQEPRRPPGRSGGDQADLADAGVGQAGVSRRASLFLFDGTTKAGPV